MPIMDFTEFSERPEVKDFMLKMYQATVEKGGPQPSLVQRQTQAINNIKLQMNTKKSSSEKKAAKRKG